MNILTSLICIICLVSCSGSVDDALNVDIVNENPNAVFKEGLEFMKLNKKRPAVKTTRSGLQYEIMRAGEGPKPGPTANVKVHYHGTTPSGEVFDSSVDREQPATFGLNQVIKGWTEGLQLMSAGAKYKFFIPQELAYGANPQPGSIIKPFMPLVFEVELLEIIDGAVEPKEEQPLTTMEFNKMSHDFGKIKADTDNNTTFIVTNTGNNPLVIDGVKPSCGCTTSQKPENPIMPGESDEIKVVFHPKENQLEDQKKTVRVTANTTPDMVVLNLKAFVEK
jgi:hypothetical protein